MASAGKVAAACCSKAAIRSVRVSLIGTPIFLEGTLQLERGLQFGFTIVECQLQK